MKYWFYYLTKWTLWVIFHTGFGLEVRGQEHVPKRGPFILASNHTSFLDPPVLGAACPRRLSFMARENLFTVPLLAAFMRGVHVISLKRGESDIAAIREAMIRLGRGEAVAIFPEGTRQLSGRLGTANRGVGLLALSADVPIIPVLVRGTFEAMPPSTNTFHRAKIRVAFGEPIPYTTGTSPTTDLSTRQIPGQVEGVSPKRQRQERLAALVTESWRHLESTIAWPS